MPFYNDSDTLYTCLRLLFARIEDADPGASDAVAASRLVVRLNCSLPAGEVTFDGRRRPLSVVFGPTPLRPTLDIELAADTLHRILLGEQSLTKALGSGLLSVRGPVWKAMALADLFRRGQALYPQVLREQGLWQG